MTYSTRKENLFLWLKFVASPYDRIMEVFAQHISRAYKEGYRDGVYDTTQIIRGKQREEAFRADTKATLYLKDEGWMK